jgi:hypothetical protein
VIEYVNVPSDPTVTTAPAITGIELNWLATMTTLSGAVGAGVIAPAIVRVCPVLTVAPAGGLENTIEPDDVDMELVVVDDVVALPVVEDDVVLFAVEDGRVVELVMVIVEDEVLLLAVDGGSGVELIFWSIEKTPRLPPTSNTTAIRTTLLAFDPCIVPVAIVLPARPIVKV